MKCIFVLYKIRCSILDSGLLCSATFRILCAGLVTLQSYLKNDKNALEKVQRRATKMVPELHNLSYSVILSQLKLTSLEDRRVRGDLIEVFKIIHARPWL